MTTANMTASVLVRMPSRLQIPRLLHKTCRRLPLPANIHPVEPKKIRPNPLRHNIRRIICVRHGLSVRMQSYT